MDQAQINLTAEERKKMGNYIKELKTRNLDFSSQEIEDIRTNLRPKQIELLEDVKKTFHILELVIGSNNLDEIPYKLLSRKKSSPVLIEQKELV